MQFGYVFLKHHVDDNAEDGGKVLFTKMHCIL